VAEATDRVSKRQGRGAGLDPDLSLLIALLAATAAGWRASRIDPAECLREG
jgi:hypothetical protein